MFWFWNEYLVGTRIGGIVGMSIWMGLSLCRDLCPCRRR
jgi:hypothetical protein